ncbi:MAG: TolC family protein [Treponema sp.]|nr:TolC family protein [Treponema sp.]
MKIKIIAFLCLLISTNLPAQTVLDIDTAVARALDSNLSLQRSQIDLNAAARRQDRALNGLIPAVSAGASLSRPTAIISDILPQQNVWTPGFNFSASLNISPAIFANVKQTRAEWESGLLSYESARIEIEYQVRRLYYQILLLKANTKLAEQGIVSSQNRYDQTLALVNAGRASTLDEVSARLDLQTQRTNAQNANAAYQNALDNFKYILMIPVTEDIVLLGDLMLVEIDDSININTNINRSGSESMQMSSLRHSLALVEAQLNSARLRTYSPTLSLGFNNNFSYIDAASEWRDQGQFSISLSFRLDNYLPWSSSGDQIDTLNDTISKQQIQLAEAGINHQNNVQRLLREISRLGESIDNLLLNISLAEENIRMSEEAYGRGVIDLQSLNSTTDNLRTAQNRLLSEHFNLISAILELERELGLPFGSIAGGN